MKKKFNFYKDLNFDYLYNKFNEWYYKVYFFIAKMDKLPVEILLKIIKLVINTDYDAAINLSRINKYYREVCKVHKKAIVKQINTKLHCNIFGFIFKSEIEKEKKLIKIDDMIINNEIKINDIILLCRRDDDYHYYYKDMECFISDGNYKIKLNISNTREKYIYDIPWNFRLFENNIVPMYWHPNPIKTEYGDKYFSYISPILSMDEETPRCMDIFNIIYNLAIYNVNFDNLNITKKWNNNTHYFYEISYHWEKYLIISENEIINNKIRVLLDFSLEYNKGYAAEVQKWLEITGIVKKKGTWSWIMDPLTLIPSFPRILTYYDSK